MCILLKQRSRAFFLDIQDQKLWSSKITRIPMYMFLRQQFMNNNMALTEIALLKWYSQHATCESGVWNDFIHNGCLHCLLQSQWSSNFIRLFSFSFFGVFELKFLLYFCFTQKEGHVTTRNKREIRSKSSAIATWVRFLQPTVSLCYFTYPPAER